MSNRSAGEGKQYPQVISEYGRAAQVPVQRSVLEYAQAPDKPRLGTGSQFVLGLLAPVAYGLIAGVTLGMVAQVGEMPFFFLAWLHPIVFIAAVVYLRVKLRWRGFLAGVLTTVLVAPIGFLAVCAVICSL